MRSALLLFALSYLGLACESGGVATAPETRREAAPAPANPSPASSPPPSSPTPEASTKTYGAPFEPGPKVELSALLTNPSAYTNQVVVTEGKVQRACSRKGCWMEVSDGNGACRVTFKDYAFFVPRDSAGSYARLQGRVETREVEPAAVEHLESEGARFQSKRADGTATEVRLVASAVELRR